VLHATGDRGLERMKQWEHSVHIARAYSATVPLANERNEG
jgi:hypothetical protein